MAVQAMLALDQPRTADMKEGASMLRRRDPNPDYELQRQGRMPILLAQLAALAQEEAKYGRPSYGALIKIAGLSSYIFYLEAGRSRFHNKILAPSLAAGGLEGSIRTPEGACKEGRRQAAADIRRMRKLASPPRRIRFLRRR